MEENSPNKLHRQTSSSESGKEPTIDQMLVKNVSDQNIDVILEGRAVLTLECLIRLRKYQIISRIDVNPEGGYLVTLDLKHEGRIVQAKWQ